MCDSHWQLLPELHCSVNALRRPGLLQLVGNRDLEMKTENKKTCYWLRRNSPFTQKTQSIRSQYAILLRRNTQLIRILTHSYAIFSQFIYASIRKNTQFYAFIRNFNTQKYAVHTHRYASIRIIYVVDLRINTQKYAIVTQFHYADLRSLYASIRSNTQS